MTPCCFEAMKYFFDNEIFTWFGLLEIEKCARLLDVTVQHHSFIPLPKVTSLISPSFHFSLADQLVNCLALASLRSIKFTSVAIQGRVARASHVWASWVAELGGSTIQHVHINPQSKSNRFRTWKRDFFFNFIQNTYAKIPLPDPNFLYTHQMDIFRHGCDCEQGVCGSCEPGIRKKLQ